MTHEHLEELFDSSICLEKKEWTQDVFAAIPACKGVLFFADKESRPVQLLITSNIRRFIKNRIERFAQDQLTKQADIIDVASIAYYKQTWNDFKTRLFYYDAAKRCFPDDYEEWLDLPKSYFVKLDKTDKCPGFRITDKPKFYRFKDLYLFGLFPNRKAADHYCHVLNTVHGLCRNPSIARSEKRQTCSYFQMHLCGGYCMGEISQQTYMKHVEKAIYYSANLRPANYIHNLRPQMKTFGRSQEYEMAQKIKEKIELLKSLDTETYDWTSFLRDIDILHIDRSEKIEIEGHRRKQQTYDLFAITWNCIHVMENVLAGDLITALGKSISEPDHRLEITKNDMIEHLAILSWFLYRKNKNGLWVNRALEKTNRLEDLLEQIHAKFPEILDHSKKNEDAD